jgi:hypothetical protein
VSWQTPFDLAPAAELGGGAWAGQLSQVLVTPEASHGQGRGHAAFVAVTPEAGDVAVHVAWARDGLLVASVAAAEDVPYGDVLAVAQRIGCACAAANPRDRNAAGAPVPRRAVADLPLGEAPLWRVREEMSSDGDQINAVLPAWSADSKVNLAVAGLGFDAAAAALDPVDPWQAAQAAMARYSRTGFEAAAVTGMAIALAMRQAQRHRVAELRFAHPYAAVAVALQPATDRGAAPGPWHGVPVFSAWVADPENPEES